MIYRGRGSETNTGEPVIITRRRRDHTRKRKTRYQK